MYLRSEHFSFLFSYFPFILDLVGKAEGGRLRDDKRTSKSKVNTWRAHHMGPMCSTRLVQHNFKSQENCREEFELNRSKLTKAN